MSAIGGKIGLLTAMSVLCGGIVLNLTLNLAHSQPAPVPEVRVYRAQNALPQTTNADFTAEPSVKQGEVLKVRSLNQVCFGVNPVGQGFVTLAGRKAKFFQQADGSWLALPSVSVFQKPGDYPLNVYDANNTLLKTIQVSIADAHYRTQNVNVSKSTEGLQPLPGELETIQALKDTVSSIQFWNEPFISPTIDCQNSPFGVKRYHNGQPTGDYHKGVDLRSPAGRPIRAISDGKVQIATMYRLHGGTVGLDHGQGVSSIYIHMSKLAVTPGQKVKKGETIGYVGSTGFATGPHLHWGMYVSGLPVNPNQWIKGVPTCR